METLGVAPALWKKYIMVRKEQPLTQGIKDRYWQAKAKTKSTKQLIRDIKRITPASLPLKRKSALFSRALIEAHLSEVYVVGKVSVPASTTPG